MSGPPDEDYILANFADGLADATYATTTSTMDAGVPSTFWSKRFLSLLTQQMVLHQFAQLKPLPEGNGTTVEFSRPRPLDAAMTALTEGQHPNASEVLWQKVTATLAEYGDFGQITSLLSQAHLNQELLGAVEIFADQAGQTMNQLLLREIVANGSYHIPADLSATSQYNGTFTTVTSKTELKSAGLAANSNYGDANDDLNESVITILDGPAAGESRPITDYVTSDGVMTVPTLDMLPEAGDAFHVSTPDEITTGDDLSWANVKKARAILKTRLAKPFAGGYLVMVVGPEEAAGLMDDAVWKNLQYYKDSAKGGFTGELGKYAGFRVVEHTTPFQFNLSASRGTAGSGGVQAAGAGYVSGGAVSCVPCFGKNAFASTTFKKKGKQGMKPPVIVKQPNKYDTSNPLNRYATAGWVIETVKKSLRGDHVVCINVDSTQ